MADAFPAPVGQVVNTQGKKSALAWVPSAPSEKSSRAATRTNSIRTDQINRKPSPTQVGHGHQKEALPEHLVRRDDEETDQTKQRNQFYGNAFTYRGTHSSDKDKLYGESIVTAEVKTNVIIRDEYTFLTDFSNHLAQRFQRSTASIVVTLDHSACLIFGGSFDPAYILTITALPAQVQSTTNKRNAALTQGFMYKALKIPECRGVVRFVAVADENLATRGMTVFGEAESLGKITTRDRTEEKPRPEVKTGSRRRANTVKETASNRTSLIATTERTGVMPSEIPPIPALPAEKSELDMQAERVQKMGKRRSFLQIFGK